MSLVDVETSIKKKMDVKVEVLFMDMLSYNDFLLFSLLSSPFFCPSFWGTLTYDIDPLLSSRPYTC